ncbi:MAG: tryptophan-rich sensory protein [Roseiflexaceae bacterium]|nr:tryptophan-rich sensory protein [Roseiflexaceae bacterium]
MTPTHTDGAGGWRWYHGAIFYAGVQLLSFGLGKLAQRSKGASSPKLGESIAGNAANDDFYNRLTQPIFAPPAWSFAPVWTLNNVLCLWGLLRSLNMPVGRPGRAAFIGLQGVVWVSFASFNALYFGLRSPINGAASTLLGLLATVASIYVAVFRLRDRRVALSQSTILPWLVLASATATTVAAWNHDEYYEAGPFSAPVPGWAKAAD